MNKINIRGLIRELYPEMQYLIARHYTINGAFTYLCENNSLSVEVKAKLVRETYCNLKKELGNVAPKAVELSKLTEGKAPILQESIPKPVVAVAKPVQQDRSNNITNTTPKTRPPIGTMIHKQESRKKAIDLTEADEGLQKHINDELKNMKKESNND